MRIYESTEKLTRKIGGDGPKLIDLLQMREKHFLQDRVELLGAIRHSDVLSVSKPIEIHFSTQLKILSNRSCPAVQYS